MKNNKVNSHSIYINTTGCNNWILKIIAIDIVRELEKYGYVCHYGPYENYQGENIAYHMWWRTAKPYDAAKINSVFITHTDDKLKEHDLIMMKDKFDSYITMSEEDAKFLIELGFNQNKVYGINLPVRNNYIRPISIGIFSSCYPDNRKNESWLLDYCKTHSDAQLVNFVFIGMGWGKFVDEISNVGCSFEWHCVSRDLPYEYIFQQHKLENIDYYLYMGMDGGAMGTYDAYAMGIPLCVSDDGYHKCIPDKEFCFNTKDVCFQKLDYIIEKQKRRVVFFSENSVENYVTKLISVWDGQSLKSKSEIIIDYSVAKKRRSNYFSLSIGRILAYVSAKCRRYLMG